MQIQHKEGRGKDRFSLSNPLSHRSTLAGPNIRRRGFSPRSLSFLMVSLIMMLQSRYVSAEYSSEFYIEGIGYREQALQQAKGKNFASETPQGVYVASYAGGTNIMIKGHGLNDNPQDNYIMLQSVEFEEKLFSPILTEDDAFTSAPPLGMITYRLPALHDLLQVPDEFLNQYTSYTFYLTVLPNMEHGVHELQCHNQAYCTIVYQQAYTPRMHYISPPIVYADSWVQMWFDPKSTNNLIEDLAEDEMAFINAKVGGQLIDFEETITSEDFFSGYGGIAAVVTTGQVGEVQPGQHLEMSMLWEVGQTYTDGPLMTHCSYDNQTCYQARSIPVVYDITSNQTYTTGGQNLTVTGFGFNNPNISAMIGGQACDVTSYSKYSFSCEVAPGSVSATNSSYKGTQGIRRDIYNYTEYTGGKWDVYSHQDRMIDDDSFQPFEKKYQIDFEKPYGETSNLGSRYRGWFIAPATTNYRFYMGCDDRCTLKFNNVSDTSENPATIINDLSAAWTPRRHYYWRNKQQISDWHSLTAGEAYYIEGLHYDYNGNNHFSVGVEIEQTAMTDHHHAIREVQHLYVTPERKFDTIRLTIANMDTGHFKLILQNVGTGRFETSSDCYARGSASQIYGCIRKYYAWYCGGNPTVNGTFYDADGLEVSAPVDGGTGIYYIATRTLSDNQCSASISAVKSTSQSTITVDLSKDVQLSTPPLRGKLYIECTDKDGFVSKTWDTDYWRGTWAMGHGLNHYCDNLYDKVRVIDTGAFGSSSNGRSLQLMFDDLKSDPGQFRFVSSETTPLTGNDINITSVTEQNYGTNIMYDVIPFEMLKTFDTEEQLIVTVNGDPAACHNMTCTISYIAPTSTVTGFTYDTSSKVLSITGTDLPATIQEMQGVNFAQSRCKIQTISSTGITCELVDEPVCGSDLKPQVVALLGGIPTTGVSGITVACTLTSATPGSDLNLLGADNITFTGTNLPRVLSKSQISINFGDSQNTGCVPVSSTSTELVCLTNAFNEGDLSTTLSPTLVINGATITHSQSLVTKSSVMSAVSMSPTSVSPVLKTDITFTLDSNFPFTLNRDDFTVNATSTTDSSYVRYLKVNAVDNSAKTLTTKFGGALSGSFQISIRHNVYGLIKTQSLVLDVNAYVTDYSPKSGSIYGGTLLTIQGQNFGTAITDNPVQLSLGGGIGNTNCYVQTTSSSEITCRIDSDTTNHTGGQGAELIVFLKTSEEASCSNSVCQTFQFSSVLPNVTGVGAVFDTSLQEWTIVVNGTDFTGDTSTVTYTVDGIQQETVSVSSTQAVFKITNVLSRTITGAKLLFEVGKPHSHALVEAPLTITPKLLSVTPNTGSMEGQIIYLRAPGITQADIPNSGVQIYRSQRSWGSECTKYTVPEYGVLLCEQNVDRAFSNQYSDSLFIRTSDNALHGCSDMDHNDLNPTDTNCRYTSLEGDQGFPILTSQIISNGNTIVLTGSGFQFSPSDTTANVSYAGVQADSITVDSDTQVTATFNMGVPLGTNVMPRITFYNTTNQYIEYYSDSAAPLSNNLTVESSTSGLQCSFAGGCAYEVVASSLTSMIQADNTLNQITICGEDCVLDDSASTSTKAVCKLPGLSTIYSNENFAIATESTDLDSGRYFGTQVNNSVAFDGNLLMPTSDTSFSSNAYCAVGMAFKPNHVGMLSQVKYFLRDMDQNEKAVFIGQTQFQGSNFQDYGYETIFTLDEKIHAGWNYHKWDNSADFPKHRYYRFFSQVQGGCAINEITFVGVETIQNEESTFTCEAKAVISDTEYDLNSVEYQATKTTNLASIYPRYGPVTGGTSITFSGTNFPTDTSLYVITLDGINCPVTAANSTSVTCTSGSRPGLIATKTELFISGQGLVSNNQLAFLYVSFWSDDTTWGGEFAPMDGESIWIPQGLNLLIDIDQSPIINAIICEGSLIFVPESDPNHHRFFDANYIFVTGGKMEVGTEEFPYTSKITITMHGSIDDPYIPIYGNKVIGCRFCTLDMHGITRTPTWTYLDQTVEAGENVITLAEEVDWQVGELVGVAPTGFKSREGEHRYITAVSQDKKTLTLDRPFDYKHFAMIQEYGDKTIDTRAEIGLLSRNVRFRGDPETSGPNQYGATIFLHSEGDDSLTGRLSYVEFTDMGQAFKLGRYAIHFHMIGAVHTSYAHGNAVHQSNNRAFTMHGTHHLRLTNNTVYEASGHVFFIEDAVETNNYCAHNLIMVVKRSWSLLNTDNSPAGFWITHPNNHLIGNHVGGSDRYGIWYDLQEHAMGPSANLDICPENERVGDFENNAAHTMGRYGLRIFHTMEPRTYPCQPFVYDESNKDDPFWQNPPIETNFNGYTGWKCNRDGAIGKKMAWIKFNDFKTADNREAGIQMSQHLDLIGDYAGVFNALLIGQSNNTEEALLRGNPWGIIGPRTENWQVNGASFYNYNWGNAAAFGSCSHCWHPQTTDHGARQYDVQGLYFADTVLRKIRYGTPFNGIYHDVDGTLTGLGPDSWATHFEASHNVPECQMDMTLWDGHICDSRVQVKGINFYNEGPQDLVGSGLKILPYDDDLINAMSEEELQAYIDDRSNYGTIEWHKYGWGVPFVTNHKYKIHWGLIGTNFEEMDIMIPQHYQDDDHSLYIFHNFTNNREEFNVTKDGILKANNTIPDTSSRYVSGQNLVLNGEENEFHMIINGKGKISPNSESIIELRAKESCGAECIATMPDDETPPEDFFRFWSDPTNWPDNQVPQEGSQVEIKSFWNMVLDIEETPIIELLQIHGRLSFSDEKDVHLRARHISIRGDHSHFKIGTPFEPYAHNGKITLYGTKEDNAIFYEGAWSPGSKILANAGKIGFYGTPRAKALTRLHAPAYKDSTDIWVETGLDWVAGDRIAIAPTSFDHEGGEDRIISWYDSSTGQAGLTTPLRIYHWGQSTSTANDYNGVDLRAEVILLTRNILIAGEDVKSWGARILTSDSVELDANMQIKMRHGQTIMDSVEIYNCSQMDSYDAALMWENAKTLESSVTNSAIHNGLGWAVRIESSDNVVFSNNVMYDFRPFGLVVDYSSNLVINNNVLIKVVERTTIEANWNYVDRKGGYAICAVYASSGSCVNVTVNDNIAAGIAMAGFWAPMQNCDEENESFRGNVAHSVAGINDGGMGAIFFQDESKAAKQKSECNSASYFTAYKCAKLGAVSHDGSTIGVQYHHMTMIDNGEGFGPVCGVMNEGAGQDHWVKMFDNKIYGEHPDMSDCPTDGSFCIPLTKAGMMLNGCSASNRGEICTQSSCYPWHVLHGGGVLRQTGVFERNEFYGFERTTALGLSNVAITLSQYQSDYLPLQLFKQTLFVNVHSESMAWIPTPPDKWANTRDCGDFPCTAPLNVLLSFKESQFQGTVQPAYAAETFQVIADNAGFSPYVQNCTKYVELNGYACNSDSLGILIFESEDDDKWDRSMQPIYIAKQGTGMSNKLNSYMDHVWDGFYTGQVRMSRFPSIFEASAGAVYDITMTGTPAKKMLFRLLGEGVGATIRIAYPGAESRGIYKDGVEIAYNAWDDNIAGYGPVTQAFCGENRFIGVQNILEFYITQGCELQVKPRNAIQTKVRMEWTLDAFFSNGGTTAFVDRITASLGIHASEVKVVSVYEGSLVVNYEVMTPDDDPEALMELEKKQTEQLTSGTVDLGAPVLEVESKVSVDISREFTGAQDKVYVIEVDTRESDRAWENSYITWDYEPVEIITNEEDDYVEDENNIIPPDITQDLEDRDEIYNQELVDNGIITDVEEAQEVSTYRPTTIQNAEYTAKNVAAQNTFEGAAVVTEESTVYQSGTVQVQNDPVVKYTTERTVVITEKDPEVIILDKEEDSKTLLIPVILSAVFVILIAVCVRQAMSKSKEEQLREAEQRAIRVRNLNDQELSDCKANVVDLGAAMKQNQYDKVNRDSMVNTFDVSIKGGVEDYGTQYDPNNDFAVFSVGDPTRGGLQSLQEKMNLADAIDEAQDSSDETSPMNANDKTNSQTNSHTALPQTSDAKQKQVPSFDDNINDLPEDQEIHSDADADQE